MKKWFRNSIFLALGIATFVYGGFDGKRVQSITIRSKDPQEKINTDAILRRLQTYEGSAFSQDQFDRDLKALSKDYDEVIPRITESAGQIQIVLTLSPRPTIDTIVWKGNRKMGSSTLLKELDIEEGSLLDKAKLNEGMSKVRQYYLKKGYFQVKVRHTLETTSHGKVRLTINIEEGPSGKIRNIQYEGIRAKELKAIQDELILRKYNFFTSWYTGRGQYIEDAMELDRNRLIHQLQDEGYADSTVEGHVQPTPKQDGVNVYFKALRGEPYRIQHLELHGVSEQYLDKIKPLITIQEGDLYSPGRLRKIVEKISDFYGSKGYCDVIVHFEPTLIDHQDRLYDISLQVHEGQQYKVGMVRFSGNYTTKPRVLMHEGLMVPGEPVNTRKLESTEKRLMNTGYFKSVHIRTVDAQPEGFPEGNYKDVIIEVEETDSTTKFSFKFGASVQEGMFGGVSASFDNFYIKGCRNLFKEGLSAIRGNGEHLGIETSFSRHTSDYVLSWTDPYFLESPWSFGVDLDHRQQRPSKREDFGTLSQGATVYGFYPINNFLRFKISQAVREERTKLTDDLSESSLARQASKNGIYSTQGFALIYDSTNRLVLPSHGFRSLAGVSFTEGPDSFIRFNYHNSYYWSPQILEDGTFKLRLDFDALRGIFNTTKWDIPLSQRLLLGGEDNLRGYQFGQLGRRDDKGNVLGGISRVVYNAEYLYRINDILSVFAFSDNGCISNTSFHIGRNYHSVGWGVRLDIMGKFPVIFGVGYPLSEKEDRSLIRRFFFSLGGKF